MSKELTEIKDQIKNQLLPQLIKVLPSHVDPDKYARVIQAEIVKNPKLLKCRRESLFINCLKAAEKGLYPNGEDAALVPFKDGVQLIVMVRGLLKLMRNKGDVINITAQLVHKKDQFEYFVDHEGEHVRFHPKVFEDRGKVLGVFALATLKDGSFAVEIMGLDEISKIKAMSQTAHKEYSPWKQWESEMQKKTVIRRLAKRLPSSVDIEYGELENLPFRKQQSERVENISNRILDDISTPPKIKPVQVEKSKDVVTDVSDDIDGDIDSDMNSPI